MSWQWWPKASIHGSWIHGYHSKVPCVAKWLSVHGGRNSCIYKLHLSLFHMLHMLHFSLKNPGRFDPTSTCQAGEGHGRGLPSPYFARHTCVVILSSLAEL